MRKTSSTSSCLLGAGLRTAALLLHHLCWACLKYRVILVEPQTHICTALLEDCWVPGQWEYLILKCCISALSLNVSGYLQSAWGMWQRCTWFLLLLWMAHFPAQSPQPPWKGSFNAWQWFVCTTHIWQPFFIVLHLQCSYCYPSSQSHKEGRTCTGQRPDLQANSLPHSSSFATAKMPRIFWKKKKCFEGKKSLFWLSSNEGDLTYSVKKNPLWIYESFCFYPFYSA